MLLPTLCALHVAFALSHRGLAVSTDYGAHGEPHCKTRNPKLLAFVKGAEVRGF